jgi:hypothetical protein
MAIKGLLSLHKIRFSKTHNLETLAQEVEKVDPALSKLIRKSGDATV